MNQIEQLRVKISEIDAEIIALIAARQEVARKIGEYKKQHNMQVLDTTREALLREFHDTLCEEHNLSTTLVARIFEILIEESRKVQKDEQ